MNSKEQVRIGLHVLKRLMQVFVVWPASTLGGFVFAMAVLGGMPIHDLAQGIYSWADSAVRSAPAGAVKTYSCSRSGSSRAIRCDQLDGKTIPAADAIAEIESNIFGIYQGLVLVCLAGMVAVMGPKRFIALPEMPSPRKPTSS